ncbi:gamma-glutamyl-hercynylcysteine sulfoxide hydrolase [Pilimelia terevasa]|uniref:Gamma-glutamyl-hercynylcysteine sulfoxide hydrolase n=1 Tax=Pilimelia terevasa TaxID=53372 RepID=A0A8J3BV68_9ACTN|nr:ergothioneine biosynthesis protein EgtC [Pilimelia terevasa]GGK43951.1 gamma-glutamyl-hercynylcysteine sulfoxide hydrolase [Pilimelia terevasa]
MCRHLAYLGPPRPLAGPLLDDPHALVRQSWAPRDMRGGGTINADGFGVGWFPAGGGPAVRYRRDCPMWADANLPALAAATASGSVLAAVRSATVGLPCVETAAAPFTDGAWLFSHNGVVPGWPDSLVPLAAALPLRDLLVLDAPTDAALLWAYVRHALVGGAPPAAAVADTVRAVRALAPSARLNLLLVGPSVAVATTAGHALWSRSAAGATTLASEPLDDDPAWRPVAADRLVEATAGSVIAQSLS